MRLLRSNATCRGMSLIEILIILALIAIVIMIAVPAFQRALRQSKVSKFAKDIRVMEGAFQLYALENGGYPPASASAGELPAGMDAYLHKVDWSKGTGLGGFWQFVVNQGSVAAGLVANGIDAPEDDLRNLDTMIDDGDLSTGSFREGDDGDYVYVLQDAGPGGTAFRSNR